MPATPDRHPGESDEEGLILSDEGVDPIVVGEIRNNGGALKAKDALGVFNLRGLSSAQHEDLDTLVHAIAETCFEEIVRDINGRMQFYRVWTNATRTIKVREVEVTRDGNNRVLTVVERQYDAAGVLVAGQTITRTMTRDGSSRFQEFATVQT